MLGRRNERAAPSVNGQAPLENNYCDPPGVPNLIEVHRVSKSFSTKRGVVRAIDELNLQVRDHEFVSIVGPSGCGKSTLLMCIAGLLSYDTGSIVIDHEEIRAPYTHCGIVFQAAELLEWRTAIENVLLQAEIRRLKKRDYREAAASLLQQVGLEDFGDRYPSELSGGMQQRVALCRALLHNPRVLLMDEPFGALDALTRDQMNVDLQRIWLHTRKTVLFVTHSIDEAVFLGDRVWVLSPRPARLVLDVQIKVPRPRRLRDRMSEQSGQYSAEIRSALTSVGVFSAED
jgi:NitT/TauT family transport system ATP-binding protein